MAADRHGRDTVIGDQIVVATDHEEVVTSELRRLQHMDVLAAEPVHLDDDPRLRLSLVGVTFQPDVLAAQSTVLESARGTNITEIIDMLRTHCRYEYRGWCPTIGKNRVLSGIGGEGGQVMGGGGQVMGGGGQVMGGGGQVMGGGGNVPQPTDDRPPSAEHGGRGARIAVVDTALYGQGGGSNVYAYPSASSGALPYEAGHATFVIGVIQRVAPDAHIEVHGTLDEHAAATSWDVARAIVAIPPDIDILNLSLGCYTLDNQPPLVLQRAIDFVTPHTLIVAAAGNHRQPLHPRPFWPAAMDNVVAVGALDQSGQGDGRDREASFSPRAPWVLALAPGVGVVSQYLSGDVWTDGPKPETFFGHARWSGTSFAAASVTAEVAVRLHEFGSGGAAARQVLDELLRDGRSPLRRPDPAQSTQ